jgi:VanZ family protein
MLRTFFALAAWACLAFITFATISPISLRPEINTGSFLDRLADYDRYIAFMIMGGLFCLAYSKRLILVCVIVLGSAVLLEFAQLITPDRHARILDAFQKMLGGTIGILVSRVVDLLCRRLGGLLDT